MADTFPWFMGTLLFQILPTASSKAVEGDLATMFVTPDVFGTAIQ